MIRTERYWVEITEQPLTIDALYRFALSPSCGAVNIFVGTVRNHFQGRAVTALEYHGYPEMAEQVLEEIVQKAFRQWEVERIAVHHRLGLLQLTEASVVIVVASPHRAAAYAASRFIIEEIKKDLPVWKKEHFADGELQWKNDPAAR